MSGPLPQPHIDHLAQLVAQDQLVLFVGAGISRQAVAGDGSNRKMPLWSDLAADVAAHCGEQLENYDGNVLDLFDAVALNRSREELEEAVRRAIPDKHFLPSAVHEEIALLPWHQVMTTNYDSLLSRAMGETSVVDGEKKYAWLGRDPDTRPRIIHIHGSLDSPHTLTGSDYGEWSQRNERAYSFLKHIALSKTILFVGYSFSDPHLKLGLLPWIQKATEGRGVRHYAWMWTINPEQIKLYDSKKITAVPVNTDEDWLKAFQQLSIAYARAGGTPVRSASSPSMVPMTPATSAASKPCKAPLVSDDTEQATVNGYKLFFHRTKKQHSVQWLSHATGIDARTLSNLEHVKSRGSTGPSCFRNIDRHDLARIERALDCIGKLEYGQDDDFLATFLMYYKVNRNPVRKSSSTMQLDFVPDTKAVIFDFGGTLTRSDSPLSTWEKMWDIVGYTTTEAGDSHRKFLAHRLTHQEWCDLTAEKLRDRGFSRDHLKRVTGTIAPIGGLKEAIQVLHDQGSDLYIVSGSVRDVITDVLGETFKMFTEVRANEMQFDRDGLLTGIRGTKFDFEGKAEFIKRVIDELGCAPMEILFVGNSLNDVWASRSGARTLCVNPSHVDFPNTEVWTDYILEMKDLSEILGHAKRA